MALDLLDINNDVYKYEAGEGMVSIEVKGGSIIFLVLQAI